MANKTIYPQGIAEILVPATESIAISNYGGGIAKIYYLITSPNFPSAYRFQQTLENGSVILGAFTDDTLVKIEANGSRVIYDVGASPDTGIGNSDLLNGQPASYYTNADNIISGTLDDNRLSSNIPLIDTENTFEETINLNNDKAIKGKTTGGTAQFIAAVTSFDEVRLGSGNLPTIIYSDGTLTYNSVVLPTGTFTTTDGKTITVTDGFITQIV